MTPGHSQVDFDVAKRHDLSLVHIIDDDGSLINVPGAFLVRFQLFQLLIAKICTAL